MNRLATIVKAFNKLTAEEKLDYLSSDPHIIELYKAIEDAEHEKVNLYSLG